MDSTDDVVTIARAVIGIDNLRYNLFEAESRVADLTATNDVLLAENCRLRGELARACSERDEARAATSYLHNPRK
jgi:hypothetical protein